MFRYLIVAALWAGAAEAQTVSDEALVECQARFDEFPAVKKCLPATDVGINMLSAIGSDELFGAAGAEIAEACNSLNDNSASAWICARNAIYDAVELVEMVGSADKISDPRAKGVADKDIYQQALKLEGELQSKFDVLIWGGGMYFPLK